MQTGNSKCNDPSFDDRADNISSHFDAFILLDCPNWLFLRGEQNDSQNPKCLLTHFSIIRWKLLSRFEKVFVKIDVASSGLNVIKDFLLEHAAILRLIFAQGPCSVWPDWVIYWTLSNFLKPLATINLSKSPTFLGNFCKGVKIYYFSSEINFRQLL